MSPTVRPARPFASTDLISDGRFIARDTVPASNTNTTWAMGRRRQDPHLVGPPAVCVSVAELQGVVVDSEARQEAAARPPQRLFVANDLG